MKNVFKFIKKISLISLPIVLQQLFLNLASLLDTLMVGQLDDASISGVYIATQIIFVINMLVFGSIEGGSIFFSQYYGIKDEKNMGKTFAFKIIASCFVAGLATIIIAIFGRDIVSLFLNSEKEISIALDYLNIVNYTLIPFAISVTLSSTLREYHIGLPPMIITFIGVIFNLIFNYLLIYGKFGFPAMGAVGAAIGTIINRIIECVVLIILCMIKKYGFVKNFISSFKIENSLFKKMLIKSIPLMFNEFLWGLQQTVIVFFFAKNDAIATTVLPIVSTIVNLLFVVILGIGNAVSIAVGNTIGENEIKRAQKEAYITLGFTTICCLILGIILLLFAEPIVSLYTGVSLNARELAAVLIRFNAFFILLSGVNTNLFFLLRAGGRSGLVFFFDSVYGWIISIPALILINNFTSVDFKTLYMVIYSLDIIKCIIGFILVYSKKWCKNLTLSNAN